jgi:hypothetical protein
MKRTVIGAILLMLMLAIGAAPAPAATKSAGVALIKAVVTSDPDDGDPEGNAAYNGATGPPTGNVVTIVNTGNRLAFTAPLTLIAPTPFAQDQVTNCSYGLGHGACTFPEVGPYGYPSGCSARVTGNAGADHFTFRREWSLPYPYFPDDCWYVFFLVVTKDGDDVIKAHDDNPTSVICGAGYDTVIADSYAGVSRDCEAVDRL